MTSATDNRTALLPCPFCGGKPECTDMLGIETITCITCGVTMSDEGQKWTAKRMWNTRATHGTLTAEQVRNAAHGHYQLRMVRDVDGFDTPQVTFDWQAIADELNTRAKRTCEWEYPQNVNGWAGYTVCSSCGEKYDETVTDSAHYCPNCGAKVITNE